MQLESSVFNLSLAIKLRMTWAFHLCNVQMFYPTRKPVADFLFDGDCNDCRICHRLRDIYNPNRLDLDL